MSSQTYPNQVLIIRHGEKLGDKTKDTDGGPDLSLEGSARAAALPSLFAPANYQKSQLSCAWAAAKSNFTGAYKPVALAGSAPRFATPDFIFATKKSGSSNRPVETITPLAQALGLAYNDKHSDKDYAKVATDVLTNSKYASKVVLICWHHGNIPNLAIKLGIATPPAWPGTVFDLVWQITWPGGAATLTPYCQKLLFTDTNC